MPDSNQPILMVVCNDYGELALAMYLLEGQSFAENTTLMLPPRLYTNNTDILPGRTLGYQSAEDIQHEIDHRAPGYLGLFSGYLLPVHRLCGTDELVALLHSAQASGWKTFTSDPFVGLLDEVDARDIVTLRAPRWSLIWSIFARFEKKRLSRLLSQMQTGLDDTPHVYPFSEPRGATDQNREKRLHFHNPHVVPQDGLVLPGLGGEPAETPAIQRWLFVLGDQDYIVQDTIHGNRRFRKILIDKLHETVEAGCVPTLIARQKVINWIHQYTPLADRMELLAQCDYARFFSLLSEAEYVFYWNATSFSCILRTLMGKPWYTFDDGHLLRGMNADYGARVAEWFYRGCEPPRLPIGDKLTAVALLQATLRYHESAQQIRQALLASADPESLLASLCEKEVGAE